MDIEIFKSKYSNAEHGTDAQVLLEQHEQWLLQNRIEHEAVVFLNSFRLPKQYNVNDIECIHFEANMN